MRINNYGVSGVNPYQHQTAPAKSKPTAGMQRDQVEISSLARELQHESKWTTEREAYVNSVKQQIDNGTYEVNPAKVAKGMMNYYGA